MRLRRGGAGVQPPRVGAFVDVRDRRRGLGEQEGGHGPVRHLRVGSGQTQPRRPAAEERVGPEAPGRHLARESQARPAPRLDREARRPAQLDAGGVRDELHARVAHRDPGPAGLAARLEALLGRIVQAVAARQGAPGDQHEGPGRLDAGAAGNLLAAHQPLGLAAHAQLRAQGAAHQQDGAELSSPSCA